MINLDRHAPLLNKMLRSNQALFMTKNLSKDILNRSRLKSRHTKWALRENVLPSQGLNKFAQI